MGYEAEFQKHLAEVQCHLSGDYGKQLPPSFVHPSTYWSSTEKNAFFHALSIHSRLRPDLIAASIGTKSVLDVCAYLDILHVAAIDANSPIARLSLPCAMEVSESWMNWEEAAASRIQQCQLNDEGKTNPGENEVNPPQQKEALKMLDACHLAVMESMLREAEEKGIGLEQDVGTTSNTDYPRDAVCQSPPVTSSPDNIESDNSQILQLRSPTPTPPYQQDDNLNLTPTSRRRLQKRIYMRRKRAEAMGEAFDPESARLRPGRKIRDKPVRLRPKTYKKTANLNKGPISNVDDHAPTKHPNKGGLNRPYRIKQQFMERKIDAQTLNEHDLGFLHLSTLARFMKIFRSGYDFPKAGAEAAISDDTIRLLTSIAVEFTTELVHLSMTLREQERSVKGNIKVWRQNHEEVTPEHVRQGLTMMGATYSSKESYFKTLLGPEASLIADEREPSPPGEGNNKSIDHTNEDGIPIYPRATIHNGTHLEQVTLPLSLSMVDSFQEEDSKCFNTLMPPEEEDGDLELELDAEMEIDDFDMHRSKEYEDRLWDSESLDIIRE